jgi:hypothetical protein
MGRPQTEWSTLGVRDFMRVPSPAARITALMRKGRDVTTSAWKWRVMVGVWATSGVR